MNYAGNNEQIKIETLEAAEATGMLEMMEAQADACMSEYDLDGWTSPDFINPDDISLVGRQWE